MIKTLTLSLGLASLVLAATACGTERRPLNPRGLNPYQPGNRGQFQRPNTNGQQPSMRHRAGTAIGEIATSFDAAVYLAHPVQLTSLNGVRFQGAVETYNQRPTGGHISVGIYEQTGDPISMDFNLYNGSISRSGAAQLIFEGQYGQLVLDGTIGNNLFRGQASFAADGDELQNLGRFEIEECGFFTCR